MQSNTKERVTAELAEREANVCAQMGAAAAPPPASDAPLDLSHLMERPEVKAAIAAAAAAAVTDMLAKLEGERVGAATPIRTTDMAFVEALALKIGELTDQGRPNARRTVAPAIMAQRAKAREAMTEAILNTRARGLVPEYQLTAAVYLSETWIKPVYVASDHIERARRVKWPGVPSEAMRPMDDVAAEIYRLFCESIGSAPIPKASDPLVQGFAILDKDQPALEMRPGYDPRDKWAVQINDPQPHDALKKPVHILGTIAEPARPQV